jgi:hypothetical protein
MANIPLFQNKFNSNIAVSGDGLALLWDFFNCPGFC